MVVAITVDVVDLNCQGFAQPFAESAFLAAIFEQLGPKEPDLNVPAGSPAREQLFESASERPWLDLSAPHRLVPSTSAKLEYAHALVE